MSNINIFQVLKGTALGTLVLWTIAANSLVFIVLYKNPRLQTVPNLLVGNLAFSDLCLGLIVLPLSSIYAISREWLFPETLCVIFVSADILCSTASIWNLSIVGLDRYWAITTPVAYMSKRNKRTALFMILSVWVSSALISLAPLLGWKQVAEHGNLVKINGSWQCTFLDLPSYTIYSATGSFFIPTILMFFVYYKIYQAFAKHRARQIYRQKVIRKHIESTILHEISHVLPTSDEFAKDEEFEDEEDDEDEEESGSSGKYYNGVIIVEEEENGVENAIDEDYNDNDSKESKEKNETQKNVLETKHLTTALSNLENSSASSTDSVSASANNHNNVNVEPKPSTDENNASAKRRRSSGGKKSGRRKSNNQNPDELISSCETSICNNSVPYVRRQTPPDREICINNDPSTQLTDALTPTIASTKSITEKKINAKRKIMNSIKGSSISFCPSANRTVSLSTFDTETSCVVSRNGGIATTSINFQRSLPLSNRSVSKSATVKADDNCSVSTARTAQRDNISRSACDISYEKVKRHKQRKERIYRKSLQKKPKAISAAKERRGVKVLGIILGCFTICWMPFFVMYVVVQFCSSCLVNPHIEMFITWLGYSNSAMNPIIYTVFNRDYQIALKRLFKSASRRNNNVNSLNLRVPPLGVPPTPHFSTTHARC